MHQDRHFAAVKPQFVRAEGVQSVRANQLHRGPDASLNQPGCVGIEDSHAQIGSIHLQKLDPVQARIALLSQAKQMQIMQAMHGKHCRRVQMSL